MNVAASTADPGAAAGDAERSTPPGAPARVRLLAAGLGLAAIGLAIPALNATPLQTSIDVPWWVLLAACAAAELLVFHLTFGKQAVTFSLSELPITIALAVLAPPAAIGARVGGSLLGLLFHGVRGIKLVFNVLSAALEIVAALVVYRAVLGSSDPLDARGWLAALVAALVVDLISGVAITAAISLDEGRFDRSVVSEVAITGFVAATTNTCLAIVTLIVLERDARAMLALAVIGAVLLVAYRAWAHQVRRFGQLESLHVFTQALDVIDEATPGEVDRDALATLSLRHARELTGAERAELVVAFPDGLHRWRLGADDSTPERVDGDDETGWWTKIDVARVLERGTDRSDDVVSLLRCTNAVAVPIRTSHGSHGHLAVIDRVDDVTRFRTAELRILETLANHIAAQLDNIALVDRLRVEIDEKEHLAMHDPLTGLPNRRRFALELQHALEDPRRSVAVLLLDLDRFKEINDTLGHSAGDAVLQAVARRLERSSASCGLIARVGGDEFALLVLDRNSDEIVGFATSVLETLQQPVVINDVTVDLAASMGGVTAPLHGSDADLLMQRADVAMYVAKDRQAGFELYSFERDVNDVRRLHLVAELRSAIAEGTLTVQYQPQIDAATQVMSGVEALVRWTSRQYGPIGPDEFIPIAECTGLIDPLTEFVVGRALADMSVWIDRGWSGVMSVNLSARSLGDAAVVDRIRDHLIRANIAPSALTLEVTESSIMRDVDRNVEVLQLLSGLGVRLSIDDFGTGYSSLAYLKRLPVHELKIDRSFTANIEWDESDRAIVRATIRLAHDLGLEVVAEGVETAAAHELLRSWGIDTAQGYFFGRPMPAAEIERRITEARVRVLNAC